ncbi:CALCIUM-ACTIVATED CHLORIDE CHANNEL REGULATOR [Salix koriyanagi]|uniref:CALCIUM-ACTIVATED CHLORIDE CHANNEL REGULATOR n=1 Tax=Salix koriyanagi TaxID=2511006 RepID=A0A9Q0Q8C7_9ROSI|nr:CALCIUM-ACTIVATED CHLORIDE CHANNEL REGULATOR [Salix koriyanagi]
MALSAWRKLKRSLKSKLSFLSRPANHATASDENPRLNTATPPPLPTISSTSFSFGSRLSRSFSLHSSPKKCAICLRSLKKGQGQAIFYAECSHPFHFNCIADNVKHGNLRCPVCRFKWKDVPFQAPKNVPSFQRSGSLHAHVPPYRAPNGSPVHIEPDHYSDDEVIPDVSQGQSSSSRPHAITVKTLPEYPAVSASESFSNFGVLVRVLAPPLDNSLPHHRAPIDIVTVLDVSGSMASKLILLKRAVNFILQNLGPSDRLSIVTFSSSARRILPLRIMSGSGREDAIRVVNSLSAIGGTNIVAGLKKGIRVLEERRQHNSVANIILLSDGCDTQSHNTHNRLEYLKSLPTSIFPSNNASGEESQQPTFPIHTFGFGLDHDSAAMHAISDESGGTFSFIESIDILQDAFARCIGGLTSIVARDVQLKVRSASPGVQIMSTPSGKHKNKIFDQGQQATIDIGDLYAEEEKDFLVFLSIPIFSVDGEERLENTPLVDVSGFQKDSVSMDTVQVEGERVEIQRPQLLSPIDQVLCLEVDRQRNRLQVTETIAKTQRMAEMGDLKGAQALLAEQLSTLLSTASAQAGYDLCNQLEAELKETRKRMETRELYEHSGRAYVLSGMSSHSWQRAATRGFTMPVSSGGNSDMRTTTSYETPSMTSMVMKSQNLNLAPRE